MIYPHWLQALARADFLKSVGLYVTRDRLFLVRMRKDFFRLSVVEEEVREVILGEDVTLRGQALSQALRSLLPHFDPAKDPLYICFSLDQAIGVQLYLPQVAEENLQQVLEYEIERYLPFRRGEVYYDFLPMGRRGDKVGLFLFAVPKMILDEILDTLSAFGIRPRGVETTATALSNYLPIPEPELLFTHWLPQADWIQGPGREIFHGCLRESPKLFGWGYNQDFLLSVKGESLHVEDLLALGKERLGEDKGMAHPFFLPAIGAALRGLRETTFPVNLLPGASEKREGQILSWLNTGLAIILLLGLIVWGGSHPVKDEIRLRQLQRENQKLGPSLKSLRREDEVLSRMRKEISFLSGQSGSREEILHILDELSRIIPNSAYLSNLRYREGTVEFQGSAESASNLIPLLERSSVFKNVAFNAPSNRGRDNRETFSLKAEAERSEGKAAKP